MSQISLPPWSYGASPPLGEVTEDQTAEKLPILSARGTAPEFADQFSGQRRRSIFDSPLSQKNAGHGPSFKTYRRMRSDPSIALARAVATTPVRKMSPSFEKKDDVSDEILTQVRDDLEPLLETFIADALTCIEFGFAAFEKVWEVEEDRYVPRKIKPLAPDNCRALKNKLGTMIGMEQGRIRVGMEKIVWVTHDGEFGNPYGRSRYENIREYAWKPWLENLAKVQSYFKKQSGVVPVIFYPEGTSKDQLGQVVSNATIANRMLEKLGNCNGYYAPNILSPWAEEMIRKGAAPKDVTAWRLEFMNTASGSGAEFLEGLQYLDKLKFRGFLVPERTAIEGEFGTKAEAGVHGDLTVDISEELAYLILDAFNKQVLDPYMVYNYGPKAKGSVYVEIGGVSDDDKAFYRGIVEKIITMPQNQDVITTLIDLDAVFDLGDVPKGVESLKNFFILPPAPTPDPKNELPTPNGEQDEE